MSRITGKIAIVTGTARGMGAAHARRFAEEGALVAMTDVDRERGESVAASIGGNARFYHHDVTSQESWAEVVTAVEAELGPIDILVNNAGIGASVHIDDMDEAFFRRFFELVRVRSSTSPRPAGWPRCLEPSPTRPPSLRYAA